VAAAAAVARGAPPSPAQQSQIEHGRRLVNIGGCNDCHTPGWTTHGGTAPRNRLLVGGGLAFQGPWGTTYPTNLRLMVQSMSLARWTRAVRTTRARPMMPWWVFRDMSDGDIAAIYDYIRSLGPAGSPAPAYVPPGTPAPPSYLKLVVPQAPASGAARHRGRRPEGEPLARLFPAAGRERWRKINPGEWAVPGTALLKSLTGVARMRGLVP